MRDICGLDDVGGYFVWDGGLEWFKVSGTEKERIKERALGGMTRLAGRRGSERAWQGRARFKRV